MLNEIEEFKAYTDKPVTNAAASVTFPSSDVSALR